MTPWTAVRWAPLSVEFSRQEYWSGLPFPSPGVPSGGMATTILKYFKILLNHLWLPLFCWKVGCDSYPSSTVYLQFPLTSLMIFSSSLIFCSYFMIYMCVAFLLFILHVGCNAFWICGLMFIDVETSQPLSLQLLLLHHFLSIPEWYGNLHFIIFPFYFLCILCYFPYI